MTFIWLIVWVVKGTPSFDFTFHDPSTWFITLFVCIVLDVLGGLGASR